MGSGEAMVGCVDRYYSTWERKRAGWCGFPQVWPVQVVVSLKYYIIASNKAYHYDGDFALRGTARGRGDAQEWGLQRKPHRWITGISVILLFFLS